MSIAPPRGAGGGGIGGNNSCLGMQANIIMFQKGRRQGLLIGRGEKRQISRDLKDKFAEKSADFAGFINYKVTRKYLMSKHGLVK